MLNWLNRFRSLDKRRQLALNKAPRGVMRDYLSAPFVDKATPLQQAPVIALDMETTGLNAKADRILSIGAVEMHHQRITLHSAWYRLIRLERQLNQQSVVIHQITDDQLQQLTDYGCDIFQGYLFSKPLPADQVCLRELLEVVNET